MVKIFTQNRISFDELETYAGITYPFYRETALAMGLIENEDVISTIFDEACNVMMPK